MRVILGPQARSPKQEKLEVLTGALGRVFKDVLAQEIAKGVFAAKRSGIINIDFVPIASLVLPNEDEINLQWNMEEVDRLRIDKDQIAERFKNGGRKKVEWSRS